MRQSAVAAGLAAVAIAAAGCQSDADSAATPAAQSPSPVVTVTSASPSTTPRPVVRRHHRPKPTPAPTAASVVPAFRYGTSAVSAAQLGKSWHSGCPVAPSRLTNVTISFWGFDHHAHTGTLVVNTTVVPAVVSAFRGMYDARFPIRRMQPIAAYGGDDDKSMAADNTSAFNCRLAVSDGPPSWSMHAYGEAIDINTLENPYRLNGTVRPPAGATYMDRSNVRPGMIVLGSTPVRVFSSLRWGWGGNWSSSPDYQHFSVNGR
jgi:D-alanyl-D-alanine carboxypeptidase-like protein